MKRKVRLSLVLVMVAASQAHAARAQSLCAKDETTYFSCPASNGRSINLCGKSAQTLQYRFGKPGRVELAFPARPEEGADALMVRAAAALARAKRAGRNCVELAMQ